MIEQARQQLKDFLSQSHKTQRQVAKELALSEAVVSQFLKGIYIGSNETVAAQVLSYLESGKQRQISAKAPEFSPDLRNAKKVTFAARYAHLNNDIALVYGAAGAGKTTALKEYAKNNRGVIYIAADTSVKTARTVLFLILEALGEETRGTEFILTRRLVGLLSGTNRLLIIDEADHLSFNALQAVRNLNDVAGIGIVFSGNDIIKYQMYGRGSVKLDQLRTRVGIEKTVSNSYTFEEIESLFPSLDKECASELLAVACKDSLRTAVKRYIFAMNYAASEDKKVTLKSFKTAAQAQTEETER